MTDDTRRRPGDDLPDPAHLRHDLALIAAHATGDVEPDDAVRAERILEGCAQCRAVAADVRAIRLATRALPAPARSRDFRITAQQAARLRPLSPWARLAQGLFAPRGYGRQLSGALVALGFAGLLLAAIPSLPLGGTTSAPSLSMRDTTTSAGAPESNFGAIPQAAASPGAKSAAGGAGAAADASPPAGAAGGSAAQPGAPASGAPAPSLAAVAPDQAVAPAASSDGRSAGVGSTNDTGADGASSGPAAQAHDAGTARPPGSSALLAVVSGLALAAGLLLFLLRRRGISPA